ncbi:hypothetical protein OROHE_000631 [Orobanche hederae]
MILILQHHRSTVLEHSDDLDIPASLDQEHSDDLDIPASPDQEHSDDLDIMASSDQEQYEVGGTSARWKSKVRIGSPRVLAQVVNTSFNIPSDTRNIVVATLPVSQGKYPEVPLDFETAVSEDAGRFYHNPAGGKEMGWIIKKSPSHRRRDDTLYDDWPGWAEGPVPVIDDIMAYIASLPTDYSAYEEEPRESRQVYI